MEHNKIEWWAKLLGFLTALSVSLRWGWKNVVVPAWHRWKDYEARMEREAGMYHMVISGQIATNFILDKLNIAWYKSDMQGYTTECSSKSCELLKADFDRVVGVNWMAFIIEEDKQRVQREFDYAVLHKSDFKCIYQTYTATGEIIKVHTYAKFNGDGYFGIIEKIK